MIPARHNKCADWLLKAYLHWQFKNHFYALWLLGTKPTPPADLSSLLLPNHSTWWDGFFIHLLNEKIFKRTTYLMMLEDQLKRNSFFSRAGAYSIDPNSQASIRSSLQYTHAVLQQKTHPPPLVCIFPQGILLPWHTRPLHYHRGVEWLCRKTAKPLCLLLLAIRIEYLNQQRPEVFFQFGPNLIVEPGQPVTSEQLSSMAEGLLADLAEKIKNHERGELLFRGRRSVNETFAALRFGKQKALAKEKDIPE
jgi:1-acyl-sn-glycerol-3-phosphate acyltransferase